MAIHESGSSAKTAASNVTDPAKALAEAVVGSGDPSVGTVGSPGGPLVAVCVRIPTRPIPSPFKRQELKALKTFPWGGEHVLCALCALSVGTGLLHDLELDEHERVAEWQMG